MKTFWENDGEPNAEGDYVVALDMEDGSGIQRFKGKTHKEVSDSLIVAQGEATAKIRKLASTQTAEPNKPTPAVQPRPLTANDRFKIAHDLQNPETAPEAIRAVVEAEVGAPLAKVSENLREKEATERSAQAKSAAEQFTAENPDYFICQHNANVMSKYMMLHNMSPLVAKNYEIAYADLSANGLLVSKPADGTDGGAGDGVQPSSNTEKGQDKGGLPDQSRSTRPRGVISSSGVRPGDSGAAPGVTVKPAQKYTREQIERMPLDEYKYKLDNEAGFAALVDKLYQAPAAAAR